MSDIKVGDVVRLKCGGPAMVVGSLRSDHKFTVGCLWFGVTDREPIESWFHPDTLQVEDCRAAVAPRKVVDPAAIINRGD
jgi:uncharacterized protein YodC (DUF2158 family)